MTTPKNVHTKPDVDKIVPIYENPNGVQPDLLSWITVKARQAGGACMKQLAAGGAGAPLLLACLCLALAYKKGNRRVPLPKKVAKPVLHRSVSMAALHGGKVALQRILDSQEARVNSEALDDTARHFHDLLAQEPLNFNKLQRAASKLEMSGKEDVAVEMLHKAWEKAEKAGQPHEAHELEMLLVEMLIYKGAYQQALECKCLQDKEISDARGPLYKAVIYTIIGNKTRAKECYKEFQSIRSRFNWPDFFKEGSPALHDIVHDFSQFEKIVNNLKKEIEHAHKNEAKNEATLMKNRLGAHSPSRFEHGCTRIINR